MDNELTNSNTVTERQGMTGQLTGIDPDFKMLVNSLTFFSSSYAIGDEEERTEFGKRAMTGAIAGIVPRDTIEAMMASQLAGLYNATMYCTCRAVSTNHPLTRDAELGHAARLSKAFTNLLEAFNRYREKNGKPHASENTAPAQSA